MHPMDYNFRTSSAQHPSYRPSPAAAYGQPVYPRVASQHGHPSPPNYAAPPAPSSSSSSASPNIRVVIKPEYRITPPPQVSARVVDIPRSNFEFNFDFERRVLEEAERETPNWNRIIENLPQRTSESRPSTSPSPGPTGEPVVNKYIASGLSREAVPFAVSAYGDDPTKVQQFVNGYTLLREMGFSSTRITEALITYENDTDKALAHFLNSSS